MAATPFQHAKNHPCFLEVDMDSIRILLPGNGMTAIGSNGFNGCTAIVVIGVDAILLAHISPLAAEDADTRDDVEASLRHNSEFLDRIAADLTRYREYFPEQRTKVWGLFGRYKGGPALDYLVTFAEERLARHGLAMQTAYYDTADDPRAVKGPAAGELLIAIRPLRTEVWMEEKLLDVLDHPMLPPVEATFEILEA